MHSKRFRLLVALLCTLPVVVTSAQTQIQPVSISSFADEDLALLVARAAALGIAGSGCHSMELRFGSPEELDAETAERIARYSGADFLLLLRNIRSGGEVEVDVSVYSAAEDSILVRSASRHPMDLYLDDRIEEQVAALFLNPIFAERRQAPAARSPPEAATLETRPVFPTVDLPEPADFVPDTSAAIAASEEPPLVRREPGQELLPVALHVQGSPLIFIGSLSELFRYGMLGSLSGTLRFLRAAFLLEAGVRVGVVQAFPDDAAQEGVVRMALFGLEGRIGIEASRRIALGFRLGGGPAVVTVEKPSEALRAKTSSYVECGASALLGIMPRVDFGLEMGAHILFEDMPPLAALAPAVYVRFRL